MDSGDLSAPLNLILEGDKKRKLETSFKIPKKKRAESESKDDVKSPAPIASPVKEEAKKELPKIVKIKKKSKVVDLEKDEPPSPTPPPKEKTAKPTPAPAADKTPKQPLLETPKAALLETPATPALPSSPTQPDLPSNPSLPEEERERFSVEIPKSVIVQEYVTLDDGSKHALTREIWRKIFAYLSSANLVQCMKSCKVWLEWINDPIFWPSINLSRFGPIFPDVLKSVVLRQPTEVDFSYCTITRKQCDWLLPRLPSLKIIRMSGLSMNIIGSLNGPLISDLRHIDLRWVDELNDWGLRDLLSISSGGRDHRPRFRDLEGLQLSGTGITDDAIHNIIKYCPNLRHLDMSYNTNMNDRVVEAICGSDLIYSLTKIDFSGCAHITDKSLLLMKKCYDITWLDFRSCKEITRGACVRFAHSFKKELVITEDKLIHPPDVEVYA